MNIDGDDDVQSDTDDELIFDFHRK